MVDTSRKLLAHIEAQFQKTGKTGISLEIEAKSLCSYYTIDVVAASAFGVDSQMFNNPNSEFYTMTTSVFGTGYMNSIKNFITLLFPSINDYIQMPCVKFKWNSLSFIDPIFLQLRIQEDGLMASSCSEHCAGEQEDRHHKIKWFLTGNIRLQYTSNTFNAQFIRILISSHTISIITDSSKGLTEDEIVGYALTLLLEGYETSSTLMGYCLYEVSMEWSMIELTILWDCDFIRNSSHQIRMCRRRSSMNCKLS